MRSGLARSVILGLAVTACGDSSNSPSPSPGGPDSSLVSPDSSLASPDSSLASPDASLAAQTRAPVVKTQTAFEVKERASGLNHPWAIAFLPDGRLLVTERSGSLRIIATDGTKSPPVTGLPKVDARGQGGLLDVEVAPDYAQSGLVYWTYYEPRDGGNGLAVARAKLVDGAAPSVGEVSVIFRMLPTLDSTAHAGGRLVFAPDGHLFVTLGERSVLAGRRQARDLGSHFGKVVRIKPDGTVPTDNPFVDRAGAKPDIWTLGHRNILSAALDRQNRLWVVEMGPRGGDELNLVERGKDYGWPTIGFGKEYSGETIHATSSEPGLEQPVYYWDPVISPSGLTIYTGTMFPEWKDNFFIGGLSSTALIRLVLAGDRVVGEERLLTDRGARIREVVQGPDGSLYLVTDADNGQVLQLVAK